MKPFAPANHEPIAQPHAAPLRIAIAGLGAIGLKIADALDRGIPGCALAAVSANDRGKAAARLAHLGRPPPVVPISELEPLADLVIECAPAYLLPAIAEPFLRAGKTALVLSAGAILVNEHLIDLARAHGGQIIVPTGALIGFDAVSAAAEGTIHSVQMITRKPPGGLAGAPYLVENGISMEGLKSALCVFKGSARDAAAAFPANVNVVAALSLAGIGPDRTTIEIWADPAVTRNCHQIKVDSDSASFSMAIENIPSENPKTGRITALSVIAALRKLTSPLQVGT
jgi:aspartate dehydrogenase